jgi:hypothetical protein
MQLTTAELMGGLGNQLFQIFAVLAYSLKYKLPFYFSAEPIQQGQRKQTYWQTSLLRTLKPFVKNPPNNPPPTILYERGFHYQALPFYEQEHIKFFGYFQSYKYFVEQQPIIYRLLKLKETQEQIKARTPYPYEKNLIAVHFRLGDYVQLPNHHPVMPLEYYTKALIQMEQDQAKAKQDQAKAKQDQAKAKQDQAKAEQHILYFCEQDDQTYVEKQFIQPLQNHPQLQGKFTFQCIDHTLADWEQMVVMSLCKHHVIANSTFSWWGAYLEMGAAPHVYYPATWFGPAMGDKNMADLFPPQWQKITI